MGCGPSSTKRGVEISNEIAQAQPPPIVPPEPLPSRPRSTYVAPAAPRKIPPRSYPTPLTKYPKDIDFDPQQASSAAQRISAPKPQQPPAVNHSNEATANSRTVRSSLQEKSSKESPRKTSRPKGKKSKDRTKAHKERKEKSSSSHQGQTASLSLQAAQRTGTEIVDHRKQSTDTAPPPPSPKKNPAPEGAFVSSKPSEPASSAPQKPAATEQAKKTATSAIYSSPKKTQSEAKPVKKSPVIVDPPVVKKKKTKSKHSRKDYDRIASNKGMKMSDIPQPDSKSGKPFSELYQLKGVLGTGAFSTVREGSHRSNADMSYAVKCVTRAKLSEEDEVALLDEVSILKELNHSHIIRLYDFFKEPNTYYLIMERMSGGELFDRIVAKAYYNEKEARDTCKILLEAVGYCHQNSVAHRDLKPENLLLRSEDDDSAVKIADFGFAKKVLEPRSLQTQCGTPGYVAPEILEGVPYDTKSDMWSCGVILYILLGGYPPFIENNQRDLFRKIRRGEYEFHEEYWGTVSSGAKDLISSLLTVDPDVRLDAQQALDNAWIRQDDESLEKKDLGVNLEEFKKFNAKRKFKAAVSTVLAVNKLQSLGKDFLKSLQD